MEQDKPKRGNYKTTNWASYNAALKARGSLTVWLDRDMRWFAEPTGRRGRNPIFSEAAIQFCLSVKCLFALPLRQSLGLVEVCSNWPNWTGPFRTSAPCAAARRGCKCN